nr:transcriptional regulator [Micromonospora sp. DSM 115978]
MLTNGVAQARGRSAVERLYAAGARLDPYRVADLVVDLVATAGVVPAWDEVCVPLLARLPGRVASEIAVEHALTEGIRVGLDRHARLPDPVPTAPNPGVLLAAAEREEHCLALHALAAGLRERGQPALLLGADVPWAALVTAAHRVAARGVVVWAQTAVTGSGHRLDRLARALPAARVFAAGPGWPPAVPAPVGRLGSLAEAVSRLRAGQ